MDSFATLPSFTVKYASASQAMEANNSLITKAYEEEVKHSEMADFERRGGGGNCYCVIA